MHWLIWFSVQLLYVLNIGIVQCIHRGTTDYNTQIVIVLPLKIALAFANCAEQVEYYALWLSSGSSLFAKMPDYRNDV